MLQGTKLTAAVLLALSLGMVALVTPDFRRMHAEEPIRKGSGVTAVRQLSDVDREFQIDQNGLMVLA